LRSIVAASIYQTDQQRADSIIDLRKPQKGISLRTFRTRYPRQRQQPIVGKVRRILFAQCGVDEKPYTSKTPLRNSQWP
jgi:hypothetical protein